MPAKALPRSRTVKELTDQVVELTAQIRGLNENANELQAQRKAVLSVLVRRYGYSEAARRVGMSKVRVHQIVNA